ncbi:MAG TPA: SpoIIE family protein phosphatase [Solirubrobacteraceae bacterium]
MQGKDLDGTGPSAGDRTDVGPISSLRELDERLGAANSLVEVLDALAEAITIRDPQNRIVYANRAAAEQMGFASVKELLERPPQSIFDDYIVRDERGGELTMNDIPSVRLLAGNAVEPLLMHTVERSTGVTRWNLLKSAAIRDEDGRSIAAVTIIEDVTTEKVVELREGFLARATETLMSSIDYEQTLRNVAWLAVPEIADWCAVDLIDEAGAREQVVVAHRDPEKLALAERLRRYEPEVPDPDQGLGKVMRTGIGELYEEITDEMLVAGARDEEHLGLLREVGFRSALTVPLRARGRTIGVLTLVNAESLRRFDQGDMEFADQLAGRAAIAVENSRLATARREIAETLQRSLLPDAVPSIPGWEIATMYRPASAYDEVEVGGDFYDFFETPGGWIVLLGDVTGRGVDAAAMTSLVRHGARFLAKHEQSPARILADLDETLRERPGLSLCSAVCVRLVPERVIASSAGHPSPLIVRDDGRVREIGGPGPILGGWDGSSWTDRSVEVAGNETLLLYTDGVTDTRGSGERYGRDRLSDLLVANAKFSPAEMLVSLDRALERFQSSGHSDDTGAVALRPTGTETQGPTERHLTDASGVAR